MGVRKKAEPSPDDSALALLSNRTRTEEGCGACCSCLNAALASTLEAACEAFEQILEHPVLLDPLLDLVH